MRLNTSPLGAIASITMGQSPDSQDVNHDEKGVPFLQGCAEFGRQTPIAEAYCSPPLRTSQPDSILISVRAPVGTLNWAEQKYCIGRGLAAIKASPALADTVFLFYVLQSDPSFLHRRSQGSTFLAISSHDLHSFPVPDFPRPTQKKIARILQTIDQAIEKTEQLIEKYQQIKAGLMHDLFTRGIGTDGQLRPPREQAPELYQYTPIGWIPKEWDVLDLNTILASTGGYLQTGPFGSQLHAHEYQPDGVAVVMPQDINDGLISDSQIAFISEKRALDLAKHRMRVGDIVIARRGDLSRAAAVGAKEVGWLCGTGCFLLRLSVSQLCPEFISLTYRQPFIQQQVEGLAVGTTMPSLNNEIMGKLKFPFLPFEEQRDIIHRVSLIEAKMNSHIDDLAKLQLQKSGLMHDLLTGTVPVSVDSASEVSA